MQTGFVSGLLGAAVGVILTGCHLTPTAPEAIAAGLGPGWNCLATPSAFDGAGVVFRVTPDGTKFTVEDFSQEAGLQRAPWVAPTATQTVSIGAGVIAQLIGVPASGNASASDKYTVRESFGGAEQINTTDVGVDGVVNAFYAKQNLDHTQRYYLVRRAVTAKSVKYDFDKDISASFGADLAVKVVQVKPNASYSRNGGFHYDATFDVPQNVCILAQPLPVPRPAASVPSAPPTSVRDDVPLFSRMGR